MAQNMRRIHRKDSQAEAEREERAVKAENSTRTWRQKCKDKGAGLERHLTRLQREFVCMDNGRHARKAG